MGPVYELVQINVLLWYYLFVYINYVAGLDLTKEVVTIQKNSLTSQTVPSEGLHGLQDWQENE